VKFLHVLPALVLLFLGACRSADRRLDDYLRESRYVEARALLEEEHVGEVPATNSDPEALALRELYTKDIEASTKELVDGLVTKGSAHEAQAVARERNGLCPWSESLATLLESCNGLLARIESVANKWSADFVNDSVSASEARQFLAEIAPDRPWILDSDQLKRFEALALRSIVHDWASLVSQQEGRIPEPDAAKMFAELQRCGFTQAEVDELLKPLTILARLPIDPQAETRIDIGGIEALAAARELLGSDGRFAADTRLAPCVEAAWEAFSRWHRTGFAQILESPQVTYRELEAGEAWNSIADYGEAQRMPLARAHAHIAGRRARQGLAATLALMHAGRASSLGLSINDPELVEAQALAQATRAVTPTPVFLLHVTLEPKVDPQIQDLVETSLIRGLQSPGEALGRLDVFSVDKAVAHVTVTVRDAELVADFTDVKPVSSSYFSHFETVVNPAKSVAKSQLDSAEWEVDSKERAYKSAVSSHNIWPTEYSLNNVNWAYTAYARAVDHYNALVALYNATPATISRPVYLQYSFLQGNMRFGWTIDSLVEVPGVDPVSASRRSVLTDFVRVGSKATDRIEGYRRQDDLDIDVSASAGLGHLMRVVSLIKEDMNLALGRLADAPLTDFSGPEQATLGWLYHPWGMQPSLAEGLGVPAWAQAAARGLEFKRPTIAPPAVVLRPPRTRIEGPLDPESASNVLAFFVGRIRSVDGNRDLTSGTATLIGEHGLLLTCAHVLMGPGCRVEFPTGPWKGIYDGELVFVNSERDVALVRARDLRNDDWVRLRLTEESHQGEAIVAIGNPGMDVGGTNLGGMSRGIVSNTRIEELGSIYLSADVSIASGSSGGPLFSLKDGALIGVVQMVATAPGFPQSSGEVAATGYLCLAAPATMLGAWLGVR